MLIMYDYLTIAIAIILGAGVGMMVARNGSAGSHTLSAILITPVLVFAASYTGLAIGHYAPWQKAPSLHYQYIADFQQDPDVESATRSAMSNDNMISNWEMASIKHLISAKAEQRSQRAFQAKLATEKHQGERWRDNG